jgi:Family of unknown function (DUF5565)
MRKIPTLFKRDENDRKHVTAEVNPECQWVLDGEGVATRKFDGTSCLVRGGEFFKRYEARYPQNSAWPPIETVQAYQERLPAGFLPADPIDPKTLKQPGWVPVGDGREDKYHREAWRSWQLTAEVEPAVVFPPPDGTYELIGPKVQGDPEGYSAHVLISHGKETAFEADVPEPPRDYDRLRSWMLYVASAYGFEGIVWHHPDGRMAKLKRRDFS